jgi:hypothetical protein
MKGPFPKERAMRSSIFPILILAGLTAACSQSGALSTPQPLTEKQSAILTKALAGRVAGKPVNCVTNLSSTNFTRVSDDILLYQSTGRTVYQNTLPYRCNGLSRDDDILVFENLLGSSYCKGDTIRLVDRTSGIQGGVCRLGEFVPYKRSNG